MKCVVHTHLHNHPARKRVVSATVVGARRPASCAFQNFRPQRHPERCQVLFALSTARENAGLFIGDKGHSDVAPAARGAGGILLEMQVLRPPACRSRQGSMLAGSPGSWEA